MGNKGTNLGKYMDAAGHMYKASGFYSEKPGVNLEYESGYSVFFTEDQIIKAAKNPDDNLFGPILLVAPAYFEYKENNK